MPLHRLAHMTWEELRSVDHPRAVAILPVGAVEAHGPHLPLSTDVIIAEAMARAGAEQLDVAGYTALLLPPIWYTEAGFAQAFSGTVSVSAPTVADTVVDVARSMGRAGVGILALANAHLDPGHVKALRRAAGDAPRDCAIVFVDVTRPEAAARLTEEFRSGACHAGRYEASVVLAEAPELVREEIAADLPPNPASLVDAIKAGKHTFHEAGGPRAYFGAPADASAQEGRETIRVLGSMLAEAVVAVAEGS